MCLWVQMVNDEPRCLVCNNVATEEHLKSSEHVKRIEGDAIGTLMGVKALSTRCLNGDMCTGVLTKKKMYDFWGDALENLPQVARHIHVKKASYLHSSA